MRWAAFALLFALLAAEVVRRGPLTLEAPETVLSNADPAQRASVPLLRFLRGVRERVPAGATIALVDSGAEGPYPYLIAVGQLPDQSVLPAPALEPGAAGPDWIACFGRAIEDPRYVPVDYFEGGLLLRRRP